MQRRLDLAQPRWIWWTVLLLLFVVGATLRIENLTSDLPAYFTSKSQDLTTDGSFLTLYARNKVDHGQWDPVGYAPWQQFKLTVITGVSYLTYQLWGVTRFSSQMVGVLLSGLGLILFLMGLASVCSRRTLAVIALACAVSYPLTIFARTPLAENGLLFFFGFVFLIFTRWSDSRWGAIVLGLVCAAAGLTAKTSGFLFAAGPIAYWVNQGKDGMRRSGLMLGTLVISSLVYSMLFLPEGIFAFLFAHTVEQGGVPVGLSSPIGFVETVISFGRSRIHQIAPIESVLAFLALTTFFLRGLPTGITSRKVVLFSGGLLLVWILGVAPFNYLPMRYALLIVPPMAALGAIWLDGQSTQLKPERRRLSWLRVLGLLLINWYACFVLAHWLVSDSMVYEVVQREIWYGLFGAVAVTIIEYLLMQRRSMVIGARMQPAACVVICIGLLSVSAYFLLSWYGRRTHTIDEAVRDMQAVVGSRAVIGGPYGPVLADGNGLTGFPLFITEEFALTRDLLMRYPVTHLAVLGEEWVRIADRVPELKRAPVVARYWLRDNVVIVARIAGLFNPQAADYRLSDLESGLLAVERSDNAKAGILLRNSMERYPDAKSPAIDYYHATVSPTSLPAMQPVLERLVANNGTDFTVLLLAAIYYRHLDRFDPSHGYALRADSLKTTALRLCPENETVVQNGFTYYDPTDRILR